MIRQTISSWLVERAGRSFGGEVQSEPAQVVRFTGLVRPMPGAQPQVAESQQARHLIKTLGGGQLICSEDIRHGRRSKGHFVTALACQDTIGWMKIQIKQALIEVERKQK